MADLKPIGSEKLTGQDKINRIMEIARFKETAPKTINENATSEYSISLADGNNYQIVKERQGYIIKKTISESETDYIEPMKNRKYYSSYSQALKRLNLVAGELNRLNENEEGVSLYGEQKKFTLKTPKPAPAPMDTAPAAPAAPLSAPFSQSVFVRVVEATAISSLSNQPVSVSTPREVDAIASSVFSLQ